MSLRPPSETSEPRAPRTGYPDAVPPVRFLAPTAFSSSRQRFCGPMTGFHHLAPSGFLNLLTLWSAQSLPALFRAGSALGVRPSELCSSRAGGFRLRIRCPRAVGCSVPMSAHASIAQLQGLAPHRESVALGQWFRLTEARSSPGLLPSRASLPRWIGSTFVSPPLVRFSFIGRLRGRCVPLQGLSPVRLASSREDALPSWGFLPPGVPRKLGLDAILELPPRMLGVRCRPLQLLSGSSFLAYLIGPPWSACR